MQCAVFLVFFLTSVSGGDNGIQQLQHTVENGDCSVLLNIDHKLHAAIPRSHISSLIAQVKRRKTDLNCTEPRSKQKRQTGEQCLPSSLNDGWCDDACNNEYSNWDGGDCCQQTCNVSSGLPCGSGGYRCLWFPENNNKNYYLLHPKLVANSKYSALFTTRRALFQTTKTTTETTTRFPRISLSVPNAPSWFTQSVELCFSVEGTGDLRQCQSSQPGFRLCANIGLLTPSYIDQTDDRRGGCNMSWSIWSSSDVPAWFKDVEICFKNSADSIGDQCARGRTMETCAGGFFDTEAYLDNSDSHPGGCYMSWMIKLPPSAESWAKRIAVCMKWEPTGDGSQCGKPGISRLLCALAGKWTPFYWDDTDQRRGGCKMQWGLKLM